MERERKEKNRKKTRTNERLYLGFKSFIRINTPKQSRLADFERGDSHQIKNCASSLTNPVVNEALVNCHVLFCKLNYTHGHEH